MLLSSIICLFYRECLCAFLKLSPKGYIVVAGNIRVSELRVRILQHLEVVESLAKSAMNGLKPEREEVLARLGAVNDLQSSKLV